MLNAGQSVILLMIITRICGLKYAGIFSIAYAIANLMLNIGRYGVKNYQVTDTDEKYSFSDYVMVRLITCILMLIASLGYSFFYMITRSYNLEKTLTIIVLCILKITDASEEVYYSEYQKCGRIDVGSKAVSLKYIITTITFIFVLFGVRNLLLASIITVFINFSISIILVLKTRGYFNAYYNLAKTNNVKKILIDCFPLFASSYLSYYLGNISKYAIDAYMSEEIQAHFNFIFMPVFFINLISTIIFQPILSELASFWNEKEYKKYKSLIFKQILIILSITVIVAILAYYFGIPVLSFLYSTNLSEYRIELVILLTGGGFLALSAFLSTGLTVIRCQKHILAGYCITVVIAKLFEKQFVSIGGITGVSVLYTSIMILICIIFSAMFALQTRRKMALEKN